MASDLSFNIVALDKASQTFIKLAEQVDRLGAKIDRLDGKKADVTVDVKTDDSTKALDSFTNRWALMSAGIIAGSPAIGAAIVAGVGAGFIATAVLAQKSNEDVQKTYTTLWQNVVQETKSATAGLVPVIVDAGNQMGQTFERLGPLLSAGFAAAGPEIVALTRGVTDFAQNAMPGLVSMIERSQVVFSALASAAGTLGSAVGRAFSEIGSNAQSIGGFITSLGGILSTVLGLAVTLMNDVARVWAQNGAQISSAIQGIADVASGLASGAMPILSAALGAAAQIVAALSSVLSPLSGTLGVVATAALAAWAAFKGANLVSGGVSAAANAVADFGSKIEVGASKTAKFIAAGEGVSVGASKMASATKAAGAAASTAATGFGVAAETLSGPLGIAIVGVTAALGLLAASNQNAKVSTEDLQAAQDSLTSAFEQSNGAITSSVEKALRDGDAYKAMAPIFEKAGVSQRDLTDALLQGGKAYDEVKTKLDAYVAAHTRSQYNSYTGVTSANVDSEGAAVKRLLPTLDDLRGKTQAGADAANQNRVAVEQHTNSLLNSDGAYRAVADAAAASGISFSAAAAGLTNVGNNAKDANGSLMDLAGTFTRNALATANAAGTIASTFKQADQQVAQSSQAVEDARYGVAQAARGVADAQHGEAQAAQQVAQAQQGVASAAHSVQTAQRSLRDAIQGVNQAQYQYNQSLQAERDAEQALSDARQQAVRDIQAVHDALANSQTSQANARLSLFNAQNAAAGLGVTDQNARQLAFGTTITEANQAQVKAAVDLISAQNQLAQATEQATNAKQDAAAADRAGVNGAKGVVSAQRSLIDSQRQVQDSARAVQRAQEQVSDASFSLAQAQQGLQRAQQAVSDAAYAQRKAHQAVADAQVQESRASRQLATAQDNLRTAQDNASRSLDMSTEAGRRNLGQLLALADAIKNQFGPTAVGYNTLIQRTADLFGVSTDAAAGTLKQLGLLDKNWKFDVTAVANVDTASLQQVFKGTDAGGYYNNSMNQKKTIGATGLATGGHVRGPGTERSDDIPAWLSDNEYVQNAAAVNFWGVDFMDDVNNRRVPKMFRGYADGGVVRWNAFGAGAGSAYIANVDALTAMGFPHPKQLPKWTPPAVSTGGYGPTPDVSGIRGSNKAIVQQVFADMFGWTGPQWDAAVRLIMGESGFNNLAQNPTSTAFGMFQFLNSTWAGYGIPKTSDPRLQAIAGGRYIQARYGSPAGAWNSWSSRSPHWYADGGHVQRGITAANMNRAGSFDNGGQLQPGWTPVYNGTGKPENVRTADAEDALLNELRQQTAILSRKLDELSKRPARAYISRDAVAGVARDERRQSELESGLV